jgi:hypothetical protein
MTKLQIQDSIHDFIWNAKYVLKVLMFQVALALMICGVLYVLNFKITVSPLVTTISPVPESTVSGKVN